MDTSHHLELQCSVSFEPREQHIAAQEVQYIPHSSCYVIVNLLKLKLRF